MSKTLLFLLAVAVHGVLGSNTVFPRTWASFSESFSDSMPTLFEKYKFEFKKEYLDKADELRHYNTFATTMKAIFDWNDASSKNSNTKGVTLFTDLSPEERSRFVAPETAARVSWNQSSK